MRHLRKRLVRAAAVVVVGCGAAVTALGLPTTPASAALVSKDLFAVGDGLLTLDTDTNLEWLDVTETLAQTFDSVAAGFGDFTTLHGFAYADINQVSQLFTNAGITDQNRNWSSDWFVPVQTLMGLLGCTSDCFSARSPRASLGIAELAVLESGWAATAFVQFCDAGLCELEGIARAGLNYPHGIRKNDTLNTIGSYLIRNETPPIIPLPAALPLFGTGLGILGFLGWRRRRKAV